LSTILEILNTPPCYNDKKQDKMENESQTESSLIVEGIDLSRPSVARMYDYLLGGYHNFEIDRIIADKTKVLYPDVALAAQVGRAFLRRSVNYLLGKGVRQFIDIGSGIPTSGHIHEILQAADIDGRIVYVDIDPVAVAHSKAILRDNTHTLALLGDARNPEKIFSNIQQSNYIDFNQPAAILFITLLQFIEDIYESQALITRYRDLLAPGSYLAFTYGTTEGTPPGVLEGFSKLSEASPTKAYYRNRDEIFGIFEGYEFEEPGIVYAPLWHPEGPEDIFLDQPERSLIYAGVTKLR
jgi:hypothetical protein